MKIRLFIFSLLLIIASCSPRKRLQWILKKHPDLITLVDTEVTIRDTLTEMDTFFAPAVTDTFLLKSTVHDTIIKTEHFYYQRSGDSHRITVKPDTFVQYDTTYYTKTIKLKGKVIKEKSSSCFWIVIVIIAVVLFILKGSR